MMTEHFIGIIALAAPVIQIAAMGFIGYPVARRRPGGMEKFKSSGFIWWIGTLAVIAVVGSIAQGESRAFHFPSLHEPSIVRILGGAASAFVVSVLIELVAERLFFGRRDDLARRKAAEKYEGALPVWARQGVNQIALLALVAVLEEYIFRSLALGSMWHIWDLPKSVAAGLVAVVFGISHWYYGFRQIAIKLIVGSALVWAALFGGWIAAALAHLALNVTLSIIASRRSECRNL